MALLADIGKWLIKNFAPKTATDYKDMQDYYQSRIEFMKADYEERIKHIREEKKKHPENGIELDNHKETLEFYYKTSLKCLQEKRDILDDYYGLKWQLDVLQKKYDKLSKKSRSMYE